MSVDNPNPRPVTTPALPANVVPERGLNEATGTPARKPRDLWRAFRAVEPPAYARKPGPLTSVLRLVALVLLIGVVILPFLMVVSTSLAPQSVIDQAGGYVVLPRKISFEAYRQILSGGIVTRAIWISVLVSVGGTALALVTTTLAAYGLSRRGSFLHRPLLMLVLLTFLFYPGMIPVFLVVKGLGLLNTLWALIIPSAFSAFNLVIVRGFMMNLPEELMEAARIDGASEWKRFTAIVLPLSKSVLAVVGLFYFVGYWNAFFNAMLYLNDSSKWPLQLVLRQYVLQGAPLIPNPQPGTTPPPSLAIQMAVVLVAIAPILMIYPFVQKHFTKGTLTGALKG